MPEAEHDLWRSIYSIYGLYIISMVHIYYHRLYIVPPQRDARGRARRVAARPPADYWLIAFQMITPIEASSPQARPAVQWSIYNTMVYIYYHGLYILPWSIYRLDPAVQWTTHENLELCEAPNVPDSCGSTPLCEMAQTTPNIGHNYIGP